jgi:hypothetical protein
MQGFTLEGDGAIENAPLPDAADERGLLVTGTAPVSVATPTFIPPAARTMPGYALDVSPTIYSGQEVTIELVVPAADADSIAGVRPFLRHYNGDDELVEVLGTASAVTEGRNTVSWVVPDIAGQPIAEIGVKVEPRAGATARLFLTSVDWSGAPTVTLTRPADGGTMWRRSWVDNLDDQGRTWPESFRLIANTSERRLMITGTHGWQDYSVEAALTPHMAESMGLAARVQGLRRYYLLRCDRSGEMQLIKRDGDDRVLARAPFEWRPEKQSRLRLDMGDGTINGFVDGELVLSATDDIRPLESGGVAVTCESGRVGCDEVIVKPVLAHA